MWVFIWQRRLPSNIVTELPMLQGRDKAIILNKYVWVISIKWQRRKKSSLPRAKNRALHWTNQESIGEQKGREPDAHKALLPAVALNKWLVKARIACKTFVSKQIQNVTRMFHKYHNNMVTSFFLLNELLQKTEMLLRYSFITRNVNFVKELAHKKSCCLLIFYNTLSAVARSSVPNSADNKHLSKFGINNKYNCLKTGH